MRPKPIPASIKVLGKPYAIRTVSTKKYYGKASSTRLLIEESDQFPRPQRRDALLHEVIHAIEHEADLEIAERSVSVLATVLLAVLRDHPDLVSYLMDAD